MISVKMWKIFNQEKMCIILWQLNIDRTHPIPPPWCQWHLWNNQVTPLSISPIICCFHYYFSFYSVTGEVIIYQNRFQWKNRTWHQYSINFACPIGLRWSSIGAAIADGWDSIICHTAISNTLWDIMGCNRAWVTLYLLDSTEFGKQIRIYRKVIGWSKIRLICWQH